MSSVSTFFLSKQATYFYLSTQVSTFVVSNLKPVTSSSENANIVEIIFKTFNATEHCSSDIHVVLMQQWVGQIPIEFKKNGARDKRAGETGGINEILQIIIFSLYRSRKKIHEHRKFIHLLYFIDLL